MNVSVIRKLWQGVPLLLIPIGLLSQQYYVSASRGAGEGFVEIPKASPGGLITRLKTMRSSVGAPVVVTDSMNASLIKFEAAYVKGRQYYFPVTNLISTGI